VPSYCDTKSPLHPFLLTDPCDAETTAQT
jgi:hypothetical protein